MIKDRFLNWLAVFLCLIVSSGMLLNGLSLWWVGSLIAFLLIGFYLHEEDEYEQQLNELPEDWEDYKATYEPPDEYNLPDNDEMLRTQVSITNGELEIIKTMEPLHDDSIEGAITNGIISQVKDNKHWTTTALSGDITRCKKCGNEVYKICMCKPVKKN